MRLLFCFVLVALAVMVESSERQLHAQQCIEHSVLKNVNNSRAENCVEFKMLHLANIKAFTVLILSSRYIRRIEKDALKNVRPPFQHLDLSNNYLENTAYLVHVPDCVEHVSMSSNGFTEIQSGNFTNVTTLDTIVLSNNNIRELKANTFYGLTSLTSIDLRNNHICNIEIGFFQDMPSLGRINLSQNKISTLNSCVFCGLNALHNLIIHGNQELSTFSSNVFDRDRRPITLRIGQTYKRITIQ